MMGKTNTVIFGVMLFLATIAEGIAPPYISDEELAHYPVIVVAKWEKAAFERHDNCDSNEIHDVEAYTKLHILRTIKGPNMVEGEHVLMMGYGICWEDDGTRLNSGTSTEMMGDVQDITKPNLWFLQKAHSWEKIRTNEYLSVDNYRQVQPAELEGYFLAMGSTHPETEVPQLLSPQKQEVAVRVLRYISGGIWPWPYDPRDSFDMEVSNPEKRGRILRGESKRVWNLICSDAGESRPFAVSVYAELLGRRCLRDIRTLLVDKDPLVRGIATGILARYRDDASLPKFQIACGGVNEGWLACKVIEQLSAWGDERVVPALITYLQNSQFAYQYGDDVGVPALKARQALKKITGHWFPLDVARSMEAWQKASQAKDRISRQELLAKLIPGDEFPFLAELTGDPAMAKPETPKGAKVKSSLHTADQKENTDTDHDVTVTVRLKNVTERSVIIAKEPSGVDMAWPAGCSSYGDYGNHEQTTKDDFTTVDPGQSLEFAVKVGTAFLLAEPSSRHLKLEYRNNGNPVGINAWIGILEVKLGSEWKEHRITKQVEETWPNGNLKATGQTVNGRRFGEWNFFNEAGDRIETIYYASGRGSAKCNPEHPDNKGAGKRPKKE